MAKIQAIELNDYPVKILCNKSLESFWIGSFFDFLRPSRCSEFYQSSLTILIALKNHGG